MFKCERVLLGCVCVCVCVSTHGEEVGAPFGLLADGRGRVGGRRHVDAQFLLAGGRRGGDGGRVVTKTTAAVTGLQGKDLHYIHYIHYIYRGPVVTLTAAAVTGLQGEDLRYIHYIYSGPVVTQSANSSVTSLDGKKSTWHHVVSYPSYLCCIWRMGQPNNCKCLEIFTAPTATYCRFSFFSKNVLIVSRFG